MSNELANLSSAEIITKKTAWVNGESHEIEVRKQDENDTGYYEVYLRGESFYGLSGKNFERVQQAIAEGAKFVRINDDLVNVNEIKRFKKVK
jgi:hypothetical protein